MLEDKVNQRRSDHDILLQLEVKVDAMADDIKELKDGTNDKITKLDMRMGALEKLRDEINVPLLIDQIKSHETYIHDQKLTAKIVIGIASTIGAVVGFIISLLVRTFFK